MIPHQLGNLSNLQYLDLSGVYFELHAETISWLSGLSLLEHLYISFVNLSKASDSLLVINSLHSLKELKLSFCELHHFPLLSSANFSSLTTLDLSGNQFQGQIPSRLGNLTSLKHLDLYSNQFNSAVLGWLSKLNDLEVLSLEDNRLQGDISSLGLENLTSIQTLLLSWNDELGGKIPTSFGKLCKLTSFSMASTKLSQDISEILGIFSGCVAYELESLYLRGCQIFGHLTNQLGQFKRLNFLGLSNNQMDGSIPLSLGQMANLESLDLSNNKLNGTVSEIHFVNLTKLVSFRANGNSLIFKINPNWVPPFQLTLLELSLLGTIPRCINNFSAMATADSSDQSSDILYAFSGDNKIVEDTSLVMKGFLVEYNSILNLVRSIDISMNNFSGEIPVEVTNLQGLQSLNLSHNLFTGRIPDNIGVMRSIESLDFSANQLSGQIPQSMSNLSFLNYLNLSNNNLNGEIPSSTQLQSFDASSFAGNDLCGAPLSSFHFITLHYRVEPSCNIAVLNNNFSQVTTSADVAAESASYSVTKQLQLARSCTQTHLNYLDLSGNSFGGGIPRFLGSMGKLKYLNLSGAGFKGMIPHQLGNLSKLQYLDLVENSELYVDNLSWLPGLSLLQHLDLGGVNLGKAFDWSLAINSLSSLRVLRLSGCQLDHFHPPPIVNISSISVLDLSSNQFDQNSLVLSWVFGLSNLVYLDLGSNDFQGSIPVGLQNLTSLRHLDLSYNDFNSSIPNWLASFSNLVHISLRSNSLQGSITGFLANLSASIEVLDLSSQQLEGQIPRSFGRLCNLREISLSDVKMSQDISEILDIFSSCISDRLESWDMTGCKIFGHLTSQIGHFKSLDSLFLSHNSISGLIPSSLGGLSSLERVVLSNNTLKGYLSEIHLANLSKLVSFDVSGNALTLKVGPDWIPPFQLEKLDLQSCHLGPTFPFWLLSQNVLGYLDISSAMVTVDYPLGDTHPGITDCSLYRSCLPRPRSFSDPIEKAFLVMKGKELEYSTILYLVALIDLSKNNFSGEIPVEVTDLVALRSLNLSYNHFSGRIPDSIGAMKSIEVIDFSNNQLSEEIPRSVSNLTFLNLLNLSYNYLSGEIPTSTQLQSFDASCFIGKLPTSFGRLREPRSISLSWANKSQEILEIFHSFSRGELS
ncbi:hypothetical protein WN943_002042 [Citrus x changshan-huyou]